MINQDTSLPTTVMRERRGDIFAPHSKMVVLCNAFWDTVLGMAVVKMMCGENFLRNLQLTSTNDLRRQWHLSPDEDSGIVGGFTSFYLSIWQSSPKKETLRLRPSAWALCRALQLAVSFEASFYSQAVFGHPKRIRMDRRVQHTARLPLAPHTDSVVTILFGKCSSMEPHFYNAE